MIRRDGIYPLGDLLTGARTKAVWTGEKRPPKAGEWYLSGAMITAYRAFHDLDTPFHIARLVETETITVTRIVREVPK